jgi:hypothetical protein
MPNVDSGAIHPRPTLPTGEPVPEVIQDAGRRPRMLPPALGGVDTLPVPRGAVKCLVRLLLLNDGDPTKAAVVARHWAGGTDDPRFALLAGILEECAADPLIMEVLAR